MVVLLTDGRANISLGRSNDDPDALTVKPSQVGRKRYGGGVLLPCLIQSIQVKNNVKG